MELRDKVKYWTERSLYDLNTARSMHKTGRYVYTAFMCQQSVEKYLKALYLQQSLQEAPRTHNLTYLISLLKTTFDEKNIELCAELSSYYIESRYPDYKQHI